LAEAGLLDGLRVTTHWQWAERLQERYPKLRVEPDAIFVREGRIWTSAGVTAGMDLALALVEEDLGRDVALAVAQRLVLYLKRPGGQSQFSAQLAAQRAAREPLRELQAWIAANPTADLSVAALARRAAMSPRHFARVFAREVGRTPARFVEEGRGEHARRRAARGGRRPAARRGAGASPRGSWPARSPARRRASSRRCASSTRAACSRAVAPASRPWRPPPASAAPRRCAARSCACCASAP